VLKLYAYVFLHLPVQLQK